MKRAWIDYDSQFVRRRYNKLAPFYTVFELVFLLPPGIRARAVGTMDLKPGGSVLEVGCGTGRNLKHLVNAVGADGKIYGADISEGMLAQARKLCERNHWRNVTLLHGDAITLSLPEKVDGALFSTSYTTMIQRREILRLAWDQLKPGGRLVIMDARIPKGRVGDWYKPLAVWTLDRTVLGNPDVDVLEDLRQLAGRIDVQELFLGTYFIGRAIKPNY
jgi:demethylmenaquinone methyltransferase/2-methoxy-6-polyprenyl-1,4-benzoquinol methylase